MQPVIDPPPARSRLGLSDLIGVMNINMINTAAVNIKVLAQILHGHGAAFNVPARVAQAPGRIPEHGLMFKLGTGKPEHEIKRVFLIRVNINPGAGL
ncbi:hypothetical protein ES703_94431 [subsurface metagenome]